MKGQIGRSSTSAAGKPTSPALGGHWVAGFDGARLASCRLGAGWSQVRLAEALYELTGDASAMPAEAARRIRSLLVQVSTYESGRTRPRARTVLQLAVALGVGVQDLLVEDAPITLALLRARKGLTQAQVASAIPNMSRSLYAHVEQGRRPLSQTETRALGAVLEVDPATIGKALIPPATARAGCP